MKPSHWALMLLINLLFGFNLVASKFGMAELSPLAFTTIRFTIVAAVLLPFLRLRRDQLPVLLGIALSVGALHFGFTYIGLDLAEDASTVAVAVQLVVPMVTLLSIVFLGERVGWRRSLGLLLSFLGVMVMAFDPRVFDYAVALVWVVAGALAAAIGTVWMKSLRNVGVFELQGFIAVLTAPLLALSSLAFEEPGIRDLSGVSPLTWAAVVYSGLGTSIVAHGSFYYLLQRYEVTRVAPLTLMGTLFAVGFGVWLLGDVLTPRVVLGAAVTLGGVLILTVRTASDTLVEGPAAASPVSKGMPLAGRDGER